LDSLEQVIGPDRVDFAASSYTGFEAPLPFTITVRAQLELPKM
jgi:hypothetical protein